MMLPQVDFYLLNSVGVDHSSETSTCHGLSAASMDPVDNPANKSRDRDVEVGTNCKQPLDDYWLFVCNLIEKLYQNKHRIFVWCPDKVTSEYIDEYLWTFKPESFIPHNLQGEGPEPPPPVQIGYQSIPRGYNDILVNLSATIPEFYLRFQKIIEIVKGEESERELSRQNYRQYKKNKCLIQIHKMEEYDQNLLSVS